MISDSKTYKALFSQLLINLALYVISCLYFYFTMLLIINNLLLKTYYLLINSFKKIITLKLILLFYPNIKLL